jgi:hypothetical protein
MTQWKFYLLCLSPNNIIDDQIKTGEVGGACGTNGKKWIINSALSMGEGG